LLRHDNIESYFSLAFALISGHDLQFSSDLIFDPIKFFVVESSLDEMSRSLSFDLVSVLGCLGLGLFGYNL